MQSLTLSFSEIIVSQIINEILVGFFDSQLTSRILTGNKCSQKFYRKFFDQTVQEALRSTVLTNKNSQFELLQRPKCLSEMDQQPLVNPQAKIRHSSSSKILQKRSQEKSHLQCQKTVKTIKSYLQPSKKNLSVTKSDKKIQEIKNSFKSLNEKNGFFPSLNLKQQHKHSIKLTLKVQEKVEEPQNLKIEDEFRQQEQKKNNHQQQKGRQDYKKVTKQRKQLQCENFPLLQNVNPIKFAIMHKCDEQKNKQKLKNAKDQLLKANRKYQLVKKNETSLEPNLKVKSLSESKIVSQPSCLNFSKQKHNKFDFRRNLSHQALDIKKNVFESQKKSLVILGPRQRRASQLQIHSKINKKLNEYKQKNILRIQQHKRPQAIPINISSSKKSKQKIIINNKQKANILISSSNQGLPYLLIESGIPNLTQKEKRRISVKLI